MAKFGFKWFFAWTLIHTILLSIIISLLNWYKPSYNYLFYIFVIGFILTFIISLIMLLFHKKKFIINEIFIFGFILHTFCIWFAWIFLDIFKVENYIALMFFSALILTIVAFLVTKLKFKYKKTLFCITALILIIFLPVKTEQIVIEKQPIIFTWTTLVNQFEDLFNWTTNLNLWTNNNSTNTTQTNTTNTTT